MPAQPASDGNPNYHRGADGVADADYLAAIARAVGSAIMELAR